MRYKPISPPFGYFGSKDRIAWQIAKKFPPHAAWVDVFCGSASMTLAKPPAPIEVINDIDSEIINLFKQLRNHKIKLCRSIALTPYAREELHLSRTTNNSSNNLERARIFLIRAMMAVNGVFGYEKGGFSYSQSYSRGGREARVNRWYNLPERIAAVAERLRNVRIESRDAREIMRMFSKHPATLMYLDPPYLCDRTSGYEMDANELDFHREILELAMESKCMIIISGYSNPLYLKQLTRKRGWSIKKIKTFTKDTKGRHHLRVEFLWMNKKYKDALKNNRIPIVLTKTEALMKKINPSR